jgi:hypothetical protein
LMTCLCYLCHGSHAAARPAVPPLC